MPNKFTEGCQKVGDRYRLYEDFVIGEETIIDKIKLEETEKQRLQESLNTSLPIYGTYTVKLWNVNPNDRNKNGRNYHRIAKKVINENKVTVGLMNHPDKGLGDPRDIFAVERNPRILNEWLCVDVTFIGDHGAKCNAILEAGGPLEFSSSALGDCDRDGYVIEEGFEVERYADRVFGPSNGLSLFKEESKNKTEEDHKEIPVLTETEKVEEKVEEKNITILSKDNGEKIMSDRLIETTLTLSIKGMIKDSEKADNFAEKKQILESALLASDELTDKTIKETIVKKIEAVDLEIHNLAEKGKNVDSLEGNVKTLNETVDSLKKEKLEEAEKLAKSIADLTKEKEELEVTHKTLVEMYEKKEYEAGEKMIYINKNLNKVIETLKTRITKLTEKATYLEALANTKVDAGVVVSLKEENATLVRKNRITERKLNSLKEEDSKSDFANESVEEYFDRLVEKDSSIAKFKNKFISCNSLREAQLVRMHLQDDDKGRDKKEERANRLSIMTEKTKENDGGEKTPSAFERLMAEKGLV